MCNLDAQSSDKGNKGHGSATALWEHGSGPHTCKGSILSKNHTLIHKTSLESSFHRRNIGIYLKDSNCIFLYFENICLGSNLPVTIIVHNGQNIFNILQKMVNILLILKCDFEAREMAQWLRALTALL